MEDHDAGNRRFGLIRPAIDVHSLGISSIGQILEDFGCKVIVADGDMCEAAVDPLAPANGRLLRSWILGNGIGEIGFSYRLDPQDGAAFFAKFVDFLRAATLLSAAGGPVARLYFAGLPRACELVAERFPFIAGTFRGDESPDECLGILGVARRDFPAALARGTVYDESRMAFARELVRKADYLGVGPVDRGGSPRFGMRGEGLVARVAYGKARGLPPLMRAHVGPYLPDRREAVELFMDWTATLARGGLLDVLSIGTSQLSQSAFGEDWAGRSDGGGVPLNSPEEYGRVWKAARPMLVRSYAGTKDVPRLARMYEDRIDMAWHALSLWWFCRIDGRGPNSVRDNLREHMVTLSYIAGTGKPFEPNVPHHFAFRGADDVTFVVSGYVAAKAAKAAGIGSLVLQVMLNTPKQVWGIRDLAKARALLALVRGLEDGSFRVFLQPRGGLDYFSHDTATAKTQLAAVTALMDDIEPGRDSSPEIIHVVGYSEGQGLADPGIVEESVRITRHALSEYRRMRKAGEVADMGADAESAALAESLLAEARTVVAAIEASIARPYSAEGLYEILASGFFAVPRLTELRDEFAEAVRWETRLVGGSVKVVDGDGRPIATADRMRTVVETVRRRALAAGTKATDGAVAT